ncbi:hypothetical protein ABMD26_003691 [Pseudomonas sp. PvP001]
MNESKGADARENKDEAHKLAFTDPRKKRQVLAHLAALQRELLEAETVAGNGVHIQLLVEANQRLVRAALAVPDLPSVQEPATLKSLQQEMQEANEHLVLAALRAQKLQADAEHALSQQRNALTSVVHEMRNPLTPISMLAQRMRMTPSCDVPQMGVLIENQVKHLSRMIEDLLDISRGKQGEAEPELHTGRYRSHPSGSRRQLCLPDTVQDVDIRCFTSGDGSHGERRPCPHHADLHQHHYQCGEIHTAKRNDRVDMYTGRKKPCRRCIGQWHRHPVEPAASYIRSLCPGRGSHRLRRLGLGYRAYRGSGTGGCARCAYNCAQ